MTATDRSTKLLEANQETIGDFINFVWTKEKDLETAQNLSATLCKIYELHENDEEMSGIRGNYDYGRWIESLDPVERANLDLRGSFVLMIAAQAMELEHDRHYREKGRRDTATQLAIGFIIDAARNQALHFHEGKEPRCKDQPTWDKLNAVHGNLFMFPSECSYGSFIIRNILKWNNFETLCADIKIRLLS